MKHLIYRVLVMLSIAGLLLQGCGPKPETPQKVNPITLEPIEGTDFQRLILTEKAAERLGIQTAEVDGANVPYAAVIYDTEGNTWVYTNPAPLTYVRAPILVDRVEGDQAILSQEMDPGVAVVIVGVSELYGAETGVSK